MESDRPWWPFSTTEVEIALGVAGLGATGASLLAVPGPSVVLGTAVFLIIAAMFGFAARHMGARVACVHLDGALHGRGYAKAFRTARHSLLLIHIDDDAPEPELLTLYRSLLERGVEIRRLVYARRDHQLEGVHWISKFGHHSGLRQRLVTAGEGAPLMVSFAVVDEDLVLFALPGFRPTETEPYAEGAVLRHLIELRHPAVTRAFLEVYEAAWRRARPLALPCSPAT